VSLLSIDRCACAQLCLHVMPAVRIADSQRAERELFHTRLRLAASRGRTCVADRRGLLVQEHNGANERKRLRNKLVAGAVDGIWLQVGSDLALLREGIRYVKDVSRS
jgi:hypothetical protein